jgi:hypothetical protein
LTASDNPICGQNITNWGLWLYVQLVPSNRVHSRLRKSRRIRFVDQIKSGHCSPCRRIALGLALCQTCIEFVNCHTKSVLGGFRSSTVNRNRVGRLRMCFENASENFTGNLQSNKIRQITYISSLAAPKLIEIRRKLVFSLGCFFREFRTLELWMANAL